ncbi:MAG: hypothetical protein SOU32_00525 [Lachnospiraceae bacterium]|nr:hypothetical protein [Lachnospiraceae bacterium]
MIRVKRMTEVETSDIKVGDRIHVGHYTATCQEITPKGALFLLDQYLDKAYKMNRGHTNKGGYPESDLRKALQSDEVLNIFADIRDYMVPFDNGDLIRIPFAGELFGDKMPGDKLPEWCEPDGHEQWPLMQDRRNRLASSRGDRRNRLASSRGDYEWGWLQNKDKASSTCFCLVDCFGGANYWAASAVFGVRPAFLIACKPMAEN